MTPAPRLALVAAFAAVYVIWGSTYLAIDRGVTEIPPFLMAGVRFPAGGLCPRSRPRRCVEFGNRRGSSSRISPPPCEIQQGVGVQRVAGTTP